jgi:cytochrome c553
MSTWRSFSVLLTFVMSFVATAICENLPNGQSRESYSRDQISRGEYLITAGGCAECHTPKKFGAKGPEPDIARHLSGAPADIRLPAISAGVLGPDGWGVLGSHDMTAWAGSWGVSFAANLTPDKVTGMGNWTEASFIKAMRTGKHKGLLRDILPPMPWQSMAKLSDGDLRAMFAYLKSIKPINNKVPEPIPPKN